MEIIKRKLKYFLKYATFNKKFLNYLEINLSKRLRLLKPIGLPHTIMIEPTSLCNLKCPLCPTGSKQLGRENGLMNFEKYKKLVDEVSPYIIRLRMWNWGEPLIHKEIDKMISYAKSKNLIVNLSTNGNLLTRELAKKIVDSKLDEIIFSVDGATQETYKKYRINGDLKKVIQGIKYLVEEKNKQKSKYPKIIFQFIAMKQNEQEIKKAEEIAKKIKVDYFTIKTVGIMDVFLKKDIKKYLPSNPNLARYVIKKNKENRKHKVRNMCDTMYEESTILWNGDVVVCCNDAKGKHKFGNVFKEPFIKIWKNKEYVNFRRQILKRKSSITMCKDCPGNTRDAPVLYKKIK
ncbi:MAG: radical SAM protein [Nanoarchaeota archaeon]